MSIRLAQFEADAEAFVNLNSKKREFSEFSLQHNALMFSWISPLGHLCKVSFNASEDYPENSVVTQLWLTTGEEQSYACSITAVNLLMLLNNDSLIMEEDLSSKSPKKVPTKSVSSMQSDHSESDFVDCLSDFSDEDLDQNDYYDDVDIDSSVLCVEDFEVDEYKKGDMDKIHPLLAKDIRQLKDLFGDCNFSYRFLDAIGEIDVELKIPLSSLNFTSQVAKAWRVDLEKPLVLRIHLSSVYYLDVPDCPKVEVFQQCKEDICGIASQMKNILESFLQKQWHSLNNSKLQVTHKSKSMPDNLSTLNNVESESKERNLPEATDLFAVNDLSLVTLIEMGFQHETARNALIITHGELQEAIHLLTMDPSSCEDLDLSLQSSLTGQHASILYTGSNASSGVETKHEHPKSRSNKSRTSFTHKRNKIISTSQTAPSLATAVITASITSQNKGSVKDAPGLENGFLVMIYRYAKKRIPTLNEFCVVCDEPHVFQNGAMLKPAVCSRDLCVFAYQTLGVMVDAATDIATGAEVVDLLIAMTKAACSSVRKAIIFDPFPDIVDPERPSELVFSAKNKDYTKLERLLQVLPPMNLMTSLSGVYLHEYLEKTDKLLFPLLTWIISSNRSHIVKLPAEKQIKVMVTPHQFLLLNSPPAKEAVFQAAKEKYGSTFAFHGSSIENWHSIIRLGLIVATGTKRQVNGAAYGQGIYLSPVASTSFSYSHMGYGMHNMSKKKSKLQVPEKSRFLSSEHLNCIALCEVITSPSLKKHGQIWVCPDSDHVCTRFFFVYEDGLVGESNIDMEKEVYQKIVLDAMAYII